MNTETQKESRKQLKRCLFRWYSWAGTLFWDLLDLFPPFLRRLLLKAMLAGVGKGTTIDYSTYIRYPKKVRIGSYSTINRNCRFLPSFGIQKGTISIGSHVAVATGVCFLAAGHDYTDLGLPDTAGPITVGDYAWIGANATVLQGVSIGEGAVIGAGAVVTRDIPPWTIAVGVPAKVIKKRGLAEDLN